MLARFAMLTKSMPIHFFSTHEDELARRLTKSINQAKSPQQLKRILTQNHGSLNLVHISALLKNLNLKMSNEPQTLNLLYSQARHTLSQTPTPTPHNARALANIIGYTGNRSYFGINSQIKKINFPKLFQLVNQKQFVMLLSGLLKLGIIEEVVDGDALDGLVRGFLEKATGFGLVVSLWRNLIRAGKVREGYEEMFVEKLLSCKVTGNIKDLGYLVYCYTESPTPHPKLPTLLQTLSESYIFTTRITIFQFCIFIDHLLKLSTKTKLSPSEDFLQILQSQYIRIIKGGGIGMRSLANGFRSLVNFWGRVDEGVYRESLGKFGGLLEKERQMGESGEIGERDYQSVSSLFLQFILSRPDREVPSPPQLDFNSKQLLAGLIPPLKNYLFNPKTPHILNFPSKELQKLLYSLHLSKKQFLALSFTPEQAALLRQALLAQTDPTELQLTSMLSSLGNLGVVNQELCEGVKRKFGDLARGKGRDRERGCWLGLRKGECLGCGESGERK